jgi:redox-sensitive bicupin YhaK (pirin superfamily)
MTAGRGITHSERFELARRQGDRVHGIQAWVALPQADEECAPAFAHHGAADLPTFEDEGVWGRVVAGKVLGLDAGVRTHSPLFYVHWALAADARVSLPADYPERAVHVTTGAIEVDSRRYDAGQMLVFAPGQAVTIRALAPSIVMALGGEPLGTRFIEWNFVSSSKDRIEQAKADWSAGRMKLPDRDSGEFIPLPPGPPPHVRTI